MNLKQAKELVRSRLSDKRYEHTLNVKKMAVKLAKIYGEDEELEAEENRLSSFEKLYADIEEINSAFEGEGENGIIFLLKKICGTASKSLDSDKSLEPLENRLQSAFYEIDDIAGEFRRYASSLVFDPERLEQVQERLELIFRLKQKYTGRNSSVANLLSYAENASRQLEELGGSTFDKSILEKEISELGKKVYFLAKSLSEKRKSAAEKMSLDVEKILCSLGMKDTKFRVGLTEKEGNAVEQKCGPYGMDNIEFLISANPGSPLNPLAKIASGGELSRVMLALKTILSDGDLAGTLVFDEIDTGVSGKVADAIGQKMHSIALNNQVLCITHLPQVAIHADHHYAIKKQTQDEETYSSLAVLNEDERIEEIAKMLSGDVITPEAIENAKRLLQG